MSVYNNVYGSVYGNVYGNIDIEYSLIIDEILLILRVLTGTILSDSSLINLILTSAMLVLKEFSCFSVDYTINLTLKTITPDIIDDSFVLLVAYKASILLLQSEIRGYGSQSIKITDGPSSIDLTNRTKDSLSILSSLTNDYFIMKRDCIFNKSSYGCAVITPTTVDYIRGNNFS